MAFLIKRGKRAVAGWSDSFTRADENPVMEPWQFWGTSATFALINQQLRLAAAGETRGGNYDGGIAFEHQPLTENWAVEFVRAPIGTTGTSNSNETEQNIFLDKNWTEGGNASSTLYQVGIQLKAKYNKKKEPDENGNGGKSASMDRNVRFFTRDKTTTTGFWVFTSYASVGSDSTSVSATPWAGSLAVKVMVLEDRYLLGWINGSGPTKSADLIVDLYDTRFRFGPNKRSANFAQISGLVASIDNFKTYDIDPIIRREWATVFEDTFNRADSADILNGWTETAGDVFGIYNQSVSIRPGPFGANIGDDGWRQFRRDGGYRDLRIEFILGGGTGDPNLQTRTQILARMNAAGTAGLACIISPRSVTIHGFTWTGALKTAPVTNGDVQPILAFGEGFIEKGHVYSLNIVGDYAWVINETTDRLFYFRDGVNGLTNTGPSDTWVGGTIIRNTFINSVAINNFKILA